MTARIPFERTLSTRTLTEEEQMKLKRQDGRLVTPFRAKELEANAQKYWDQFYNRNGNKFFKDRCWTAEEFQELISNDMGVEKSLLEVGCGVGNLLFPLIRDTLFCKFYACDFSEKAILHVKNHALYNPEKIIAFQSDITTSNLLSELDGHLVDIVTLVFVLSAIHPNKWDCSVRNIYECVKPGGLILFRDYAVNDMTQVRFKPGNKISDNFYMRQDGTTTYFTTIEKVHKLFVDAGFVVEECCYIHSKTINIKEGINVPRTFLQAKFKKI